MIMENSWTYHKFPEKKKEEVVPANAVKITFYGRNNGIAETKRMVEDIRRFIYSAAQVMCTVEHPAEVIEKYSDCLRLTVMAAVDEVNLIVEKHHITDDEDVQELRNMVMKLLDDVDELSKRYIQD